MRILVDLTHPAHVHFFKHAVWAWQRMGHMLALVSRDKDLTLTLLDHYGFEHRCLGRAGRGRTGLAVELITRTARLYRLTRSFQPDVLVAVGGAWIAPVGRLSGVPAIVFYGTEVATLNNLYVYRLADAVCTPMSYQGSAGPRHVRFRGNHELAYLHPSRFSPDPSFLSALGLTPDEPYIVVRTVAWMAHHDVGQSGFADLRTAVHTLERHGRVLLSSEGAVSPDLERYRLRIAPHVIHHVLAFARLYVGESATMASESALLGVPAIFVSSTRRGFIDEYEHKYGLVFTIDERGAGKGRSLAKATELLALPDLRERWRERRAALLRDAEDVTQWIINFVNRYDACQRP